MHEYPVFYTPCTTHQKIVPAQALDADCVHQRPGPHSVLYSQPPSPASAHVFTT